MAVSPAVSNLMYRRLLHFQNMLRHFIYITTTNEVSQIERRKLL